MFPQQIGKLFRHNGFAEAEALAAFRPQEPCAAIDSSLLSQPSEPISPALVKLGKRTIVNSSW